MADLGVQSKHRGRGIADKLVSRRIDSMPKGATVLMRTSLQNAGSQRLYQKRGFTQIEGTIQEVSRSRVDGTTYTDKRFFLVKKM
jgi:ribosomal protein S18 acetylase RimI-like enzyme